MRSQPEKRARFLADEFHSESWSVSAARAREIAPEDPANSSYEKAALALSVREFSIARNTAGPLTGEVLAGADVLALVHPCDPRWERTTSQNPPALSASEIAAIAAWVHGGGGLLVVTEYEHDKYGDNLNELLARWGIRIENGKVFDRTACTAGNAEWFHAAPVEGSPTGHLAADATFYRAGWLSLTGTARAAWQAAASAHPPGACVVALAESGLGRVAVVTDSVLFGDERIGEKDHLQLWLNLTHWLAAPAFCRSQTASERPHGLAGRADPAPCAHWTRLKGLVDTLRAVQQPDGSVAPPSRAGAGKLVGAIAGELSALEPGFAHQAAWFAQSVADLRRWAAEDFQKPDFSASLEFFRPEQHRRDGLEHLFFFPMYTPNASSDTRFEAVRIRTVWPLWLEELEATAYRNPKFVPVELLDFTSGYASECAVLFPETVSVAARGTNHFGGISCDREAARLQSTALRAAEAAGMVLFPEMECLLGNRAMLTHVCALWDLIHDRAHSLGELPFDPFMIRQRAPFWMYGLEELRVDVRAFGEAARLAESGFPFARHVCTAIVLDRLFRFPITGPRVRNYDALGGQVLFTALHQVDAIVWRDNRLTMRWEAVPAAVAALSAEITALYRLGTDCSRVAFWNAAHEFVARHVRPNTGSRWRADCGLDESDPKAWLALVHDDEFPLGNFHVNLQRKLGASGLRT